MDILKKILLTKEQEVSALKKQTPLVELKSQIDDMPPTRAFAQAMLTHRPAIIAEIKKASPSKGVIRKDFDPVAIAKSYQQHHATCLSVLTDQTYFQGNNQYLTSVKNAVTIPVLRKDFIIDPYQIYEARLIGADCILLIVAALAVDQLIEFSTIASSLQLDVLVEVHDEKELQSALTLPTQLIGINNRNLHTFTTDLNTTINLLPLIPKDKLVISESGILHTKDIQFLSEHDVNAYLIGEALMRADDPGLALRELFL